LPSERFLVASLLGMTGRMPCGHRNDRVRGREKRFFRAIRGAHERPREDVPESEGLARPAVLLEDGGRDVLLDREVLA
jgi:hypothetical protein